MQDFIFGLLKDHPQLLPYFESPESLQVNLILTPFRAPHLDPRRLIAVRLNASTVEKKDTELDAASTQRT